MKEYRVIRLDTGSLMTIAGYRSVRPETQHGTFSTRQAAEQYANDLRDASNTWWTSKYGYQVQVREVITPWEPV